MVNKIREVIVSIVKHENFEITNELTATDVEGWDSLTHMEIITGIEEAFHVKFKLRELNKLKKAKFSTFQLEGLLYKYQLDIL